MLAKAKQRIALIPTPDWSERDYDIDADPLWTYNPEPQPFEQLYFYHTDHLGTPQELTDAEGNLAWSADYKAWGEANAVISEAAKRAGISNPLRFQGQYFDHETGLHYNRHRYYDPSVGRFISKDPIGLMGGLNIFAYAPNPVEWIDPLGLARKKRQSLSEGSVGRHGDLKKNPGGTQSHHLNQDAAYNSVIPSNEGAAVLLSGNAFCDCQSSHYKAHQSLEQFWDQYRKGGSKYPSLPTNLEYSKALSGSLRHAGLSDAQVKESVRAASKQRVQYGQLGGMNVPRVPGKIYQRK